MVCKNARFRRAFEWNWAFESILFPLAVGIFFLKFSRHCMEIDTGTGMFLHLITIAGTDFAE